MFFGHFSGGNNLIDSASKSPPPGSSVSCRTGSQDHFFGMCLGARGGGGRDCRTAEPALTSHCYTGGMEHFECVQTSSVEALGHSFSVYRHRQHGTVVVLYPIPGPLCHFSLCFLTARGSARRRPAIPDPNVFSFFFIYFQNPHSRLWHISHQAIFFPVVP